MVKGKGFLLFFTIVALLVGACMVSMQNKEDQRTHEDMVQTEAMIGTHAMPEDLYTIYVDTLPFTVSVAANEQDREQGLSGVTALPQGEGKLFIFDRSDTYGFWMKDMHFPIDIIWFDAQGKLVHIAHSVTPESFPELFAPEQPALYVLEINAGVSAAANFSSSSTLVFGEALQTFLQGSDAH